MSHLKLSFLLPDLPCQLAVCQSLLPRKEEAGSLCPYLLLLQADHGAIAAAPPLPLESCNFLCLDAQDLLVLLVFQFQLLCGEQRL